MALYFGCRINKNAILGAELTKTHSFRLFFRDFDNWVWTSSSFFKDFAKTAENRHGVTSCKHDFGSL